MERSVTVWGRPCTVSLYQRSRSVWVATGEYMGSHLETQDRSPGAALKRWKEAATTRGG